MSDRVGLWLIGACGGVASVATVGVAGLEKGLVGKTGLTSDLDVFHSLELSEWDTVVVGGHEIRDVSLVAEARRFQQTSRAFDEQVLKAVESQLEAVQTRIRPGILHHAGPAIELLASPELAHDDRTARQKVAAVRTDLEAFAQDNSLDRVVVVNLASTERTVDPEKLPADWAGLEACLDDASCPLPASSLYGIAAFQAGCAYVNFTPSLGTRCAALEELALQSNAVHAGSDGKTGETLLKSALAPAFAIRNLEVMSWVGHNIFGNLDGKVLDDPENKKTKVQSKDRMLGQILGYHPQSHISIEYIESLGDWKTAWDHVHFRGFLGTPMTMQFTWQGCDSILAAPLVLDLFRFTERAMRAGAAGVLDWLACFFKSPMQVTENSLELQFQMLVDWARAQSKE